jgi:hypothetical protein
MLYHRGKLTPRMTRQECLQRHGALAMQTEPEWLTLAEAGDRVRITEA